MNKMPASAIDRRTVVRGAIAAAIAPLIATRHAHAQDASGGLIAPPDHPMTFQRAITRTLVDGRSFRVARSFAVEFRRFSDGFMVHGEQVDVAVEAPPALAQFAELERTRNESGMFPIALDPFGRILSPGHELGDGGVVDRAVRQALAALAGQPLAQGERATLQNLVTALHTAGQDVTAYLPFDLFAPPISSRQQEQGINLPDGAHGRVLTLFEGRRDDGTGLMREAMREIVTEVDDSRRIIREQWSLVAR